MVKLSPVAFADATAQMCRHSGIGRTRLAIKLRPRSGTVVLRSTDDRTTLTAVATTQGEMKIVEKVVQQYLSDCTANAIAAAAESAEASAGKKGKGKGKSKK